MDTQTFLDNLKIHADLFTETSQIPNDFFDFFESNYETYINATTEERENIREFVKPPSKPKSFLGGLFQPKKSTSQIPRSQISPLLLIYVKDRVLPQLKSTKDKEWIVRGLVAMSIENLTGKFYDKDYLGEYPSGDASLLIIDLYVTSEELGINVETLFTNIAEISNAKGAMTISGLMKAQYLGPIFHERRTKGKFVGMFN